jgi:sulfoxide reductase heme-binding subunit YedZ
MATAVAPHIYWIISRAAGSAALVLSSLSVCVGLSMGGRLLKRRGPDLRVTHEALSLATIAALLVHGLSLLGDAYLHASILDVSVPFVSSYKAPWMAMGLVGGWAMILLGLSYYFRGKIGPARWRVLHRFTALAWLLGLAHSLGEGSDAGQTWFLAMFAVVTVPALALLVARVTGSRRASRASSAAPRPARAGVDPAFTANSQNSRVLLPAAGAKLSP